MAAAPVGVDRVAEGHERGLRNLVDDAAGPNVEELHAPELAPPDVARDLGEQGALGDVAIELPAQVGAQSHVVQCSEQTFVTQEG